MPRRTKNAGPKAVGGVGAGSAAPGAAGNEAGIPAGAGRGARFSDKADVTALLGAFCFFLSAIEYMLPKPMPFMRLGIANLPILFAVDILPFGWFLTLAIVKVIGMSVISGSLFSFVALFSLSGTLAAALVMWGARRLGGRLISQIGVSILGALASNAVQIVLARYIVFGQAAWLIAPVFLAMGLATGTALGVFAERFASRSVWFATAAGRPAPPNAAGADLARPAAATDPRAAASPRQTTAGAAASAARAAEAAARRAHRRAARKQRFEDAFSPWAAALAGALLAFVFLFERSLAVKAAMFVFFAAAAVLSGKRVSFLSTLLVSLGIVGFNLLLPSGRVLARIGSFAITQSALTDGIAKALTFEGLLMLSKASIMRQLHLPGKLGGIVAAAFLYYDRIVEYKGRIRPSSLSADADAMMRAVWESENLDTPAGAADKAKNAPPPEKRKKGGDTALVFIVAVFALVSFLL